MLDCTIKLLDLAIVKMTSEDNVELDNGTKSACIIVSCNDILATSFPSSSFSSCWPWARLSLDRLVRQ